MLNYFNLKKQEDCEILKSNIKKRHFNKYKTHVPFDKSPFYFTKLLHFKIEQYS